MAVEAIVLGVAQDAGVPQAGCICARCDHARRDPAQRHLVACLGLIDTATHQYWLIDATPDFRDQIHTLAQQAYQHTTSLPNPPNSFSSLSPFTFAGILLTHAHIGHYTGLIHLGREAWNRRELPVYATARMGAFLHENAPWSQLVDEHNINLFPLVLEQELALAPSLHVTPIPVRHRAEWSDTIAFLVRGPRRRLLYCPDVDGWSEGKVESGEWGVGSG
ncbi:MAG: MBL fold metallo-hydrolase, partial [Ardenticatenaceae bacterium]